MVGGCAFGGFSVFGFRFLVFGFLRALAHCSICSAVLPVASATTLPAHGSAETIKSEVLSRLLSNPIVIETTRASPSIIEHEFWNFDYWVF